MPIIFVIILAASLFITTAFAEIGGPTNFQMCPPRIVTAQRYLLQMGVQGEIAKSLVYNDNHNDKSHESIRFKFVSNKGILAARFDNNRSAILNIFKGEEFPVLIRPASQDFRMVSDYEFTVLVYIPKKVLRFIVGVPAPDLSQPPYLDTECWISTSQKFMSFDGGRSDMLHHCHTTTFSGDQFTSNYDVKIEYPVLDCQAPLIEAITDNY